MVKLLKTNELMVDALTQINQSCVLTVSKKKKKKRLIH